MKQTLSIMAIVASLSLPATANVTPYIQGSVGVLSSLMDYDLDIEGVGTLPMQGDTGFQLGGAFGFQINPNFRSELEISYGTYDSKDDLDLGEKLDLIFTSFSLNAYYDFATKENVVVPYVGAGFGITQIDGEDSVGEEDSATPLHIQVKGGISFPLANGKTAFSIDYTFKKIFEAEFDDGISVDNLTTHTFALGIRHKF